MDWSYSWSSSKIDTNWKIFNYTLWMQNNINKIEIFQQLFNKPKIIKTKYLQFAQNQDATMTLVDSLLISLKSLSKVCNLGFLWQLWTRYHNLLLLCQCKILQKPHYSTHKQTYYYQPINGRAKHCGALVLLKNYFKNKVVFP
jgi:hypothetical protein